MTPNFPLDSILSGCYIPTELKGHQMRAVREANGVTQADLAAKLGISRAYLTQMETGVRRISQRTALAFVAVINQYKAKQAKSA